MNKKEILEKLNNLKTQYIYQRHNGVITKYEVIDNYLIDTKNANNMIDTKRQIPLGKTSENIIDLIEVGDYVNGMRVIATENRGRYNEEKQKDEKVILAENYDEWTENGVISNEDIKNIVTKEQFNSVMYKVGDIE